MKATVKIYPTGLLLIFNEKTSWENFCDRLLTPGNSFLTALSSFLFFGYGNDKLVKNPLFY